MSDGVLDALREAILTAISWVDVVGDNIQSYMKQRDLRIGRENKMIKGELTSSRYIERRHPANCH